MENEKIIVKGSPQKNQTALIILIAGIVLAVGSLFVANYVFNNCDGYEYFGSGYGGWYYWWVIYDSFGEFFTSEFFNFDCYFGYILILGIIAIIVGLIMKLNTEKCEITVTDNRIWGKLKGGVDVDIPLNQVTGIHTCSFNGISVSSIGKVSNFYLMSNREEVMKGISYLLARGNSQNSSATVMSASEPTGDAAKIKQYKELLDAGVISQEEFEAKKKQILGL